MATKNSSTRNSDTSVDDSNAQSSDNNDNTAKSNHKIKCENPKNSTVRTQKIGNYNNCFYGPRATSSHSNPVRTAAWHFLSCPYHLGVQSLQVLPTLPSSRDGTNAVGCTHGSPTNLPDVPRDHHAIPQRAFFGSLSRPLSSRQGSPPLPMYVFIPPPLPPRR